MIIERNDKEIILRIPSDLDKYGVERVLNYINYLELTSSMKAKQKDADELAEELNENWWRENKDKFLQE